MRDMKDLIKQVDLWARERGIYEHGTAEGQLKKMIEEVIELKDESVRMNFDKNQAQTTHTQMELGDVFVTAIVFAKLHGWEPAECLELAVNKITKRHGEMKNGQFVKAVH